MFLDLKILILPVYNRKDNIWHKFIKCKFCWPDQGILKGEVSLYHWPPVWLVWNQLYDSRQFLFLFAKQTNPNLSNRSSMVQWYPPLVFPGQTNSSPDKFKQASKAKKNGTLLSWNLSKVSINLKQGTLSLASYAY